MEAMKRSKKDIKACADWYFANSAECMGVRYMKIDIPLKGEFTAVELFDYWKENVKPKKP
jgi:hypothetical protein